jgi:tRNA A-37 threonylcarbamoyl transferase component Bud32
MLQTELDLIKEKFRNIIGTGTDIKQLQYAELAENICHEKIDLYDLLNCKNNSIIINIEKDIIRYKSITNELQKLSIYNFIHLKATYWKEKLKFQEDFNMIMNFMKQFNKLIPDKIFTQNDFSEWNDSNIYIQDGPLACYCSHVRAMIYGYLNFENYTIIIEDDAYIANTEKINMYIKQIPNDWDIIFFNSAPIFIKYDDPYYKLKNIFHSAHFYIIKNNILPKIFSKIYPIYDQIDVLIANMYNELNIYNIVDTVYQKNFSTNTQNNLYVIYNTPNYENCRKRIENILQIVKKILIKKLSLINDTTIINIANNILHDVIFNYIINNFNYNNSDILNHDVNIIELNINIDEIIKNFDDIDKELFYEIFFLINGCVKGINNISTTSQLFNDIYMIINNFNLQINIYYPKSYGSTSNIYLSNNQIIKKYNNTLRWKNHNHNNITDIMNKEIQILNILYEIIGPQIISHDKNTIIMSYVGENLYDNFYLPKNWKDQINNIFNTLTKYNIYYPEFNIKNITVLNDIISFIDYGLCEISNKSNENNNKNFIKLLEMLENKFLHIEDNFKKNLLYKTLISNLKLDNKYPQNIF